MVQDLYGMSDFAKVIVIRSPRLQLLDYVLIALVVAGILTLTIWSIKKWKKNKLSNHLPSSS